MQLSEVSNPPVKHGRPLWFLENFIWSTMTHPITSCLKAPLNNWTTFLSSLKFEHQNSFSLCHTVYIQTLFMSEDFFVFPNIHLWFIQKFLYIHSLLTHTKISFRTLFTHAKILLYTYSFYIYIWETFLFFLLLLSSHLFSFTPSFSIHNQTLHESV